MVDAGGAGCVLDFFASQPNPPGTSPSLLGAAYTDAPFLPADVINTLNGARMQEAATDIRPEDAKFAVARMLTVCGQPFTRNAYIQTSYQTYGLGYGNQSTQHTGTPVQSFTNLGTQFSVYDFNISGYDPITSVALGSRANWAATVVGAQPIVVVVSPNDGAAGRLASSNDIIFSTLSEYFLGGYGRTSDLTGDELNEHAVTALIPEPQSGTYNVFEYSVPNSNEFKTSQDINNCNGIYVNENPLHDPSANGAAPGAFRVRALGTDQVTAALKAATTDTIGYFFWSAGNAEGFTPATGKYLTVNGVDPLLDSYGMSGGVAYNPGELPHAGNVAPHPPLTAVTFKNLNQGDYAIWSALRIVSVSPVPAGVTNLVAAAQTINATANDFVPLSSLQVWKSHFNISSLSILNNNNGNTVNPATPGDLCPGSAGEGGGEVGGMTISIHGNKDFCTDFATPIGINDKNQ